MVKKYKVIKEDLKSPYKGFQYEIGQTYVCPDFDESDNECSRGFYATDLEGLPYAYQKGRKVFEVEMGGREKSFNQYKHRWETQTILREVPEGELRELLEKESERVGYNLSEACFPLNPLTDVEYGEITDEDIENLKKWSSVGASVGASVGNSVRASVGASVGNSVGASFWASVGDSVGAYFGTLFKLPQWGKSYPYQPAVDLWKMGLVPSYDGEVWRLHGGKDAKILWEGKL